MPTARVSMRKKRDVLRLTHAMVMSRRLVCEATGIGKTVVGDYVRRAAIAGIGWPLPDEIDDTELERRLFPPAIASSATTRTEPDWSHIHVELKRRGVTLVGRVEHRHPRLCDGHQHHGDAQDRPQPRDATGGDRWSGTQRATGDGLQLCRMEAGSRCAGLSHRDRRLLLFCAVEADPEDRRGAHHQRDGRDLPQGPACREPCVLARCATGTRPSPSTCRARIAATPNGRRPG